jgi:hypothetical protein
MDYRVNQRLIECLRRGWPAEGNLYDAAVWSAISDLSEQSVAEGSRPVAVPDLTRGRWEDDAIPCAAPSLRIPGDPRNSPVSSMWGGTGWAR